MNSAESIDPIATIQMHARCTRLGNRSQPNSHRPKNVDSKKNAASPSIANGAPNTSPTNREYFDQFIPNSNSCTSPVTTPTATLISSNVPKNRVTRRYSGLPVAIPRCLQHRDQERQPDRHRHEQEVVDARRRELPPRQIVGHRCAQLRPIDSQGATTDGSLAAAPPQRHRAGWLVSVVQAHPRVTRRETPRCEWRGRTRRAV